MDTPPIEARSLHKSFGLNVVLRGVNLRVGAGELAMIVGRNGAGKSTLIRILAGLSAPADGEALLFGRPALNLEPELRARLGLLTHQSFLYSNLTARENLEFYAHLYGCAADDAAIGGWLERVGLAAAAEQRVRTFSRGMEQRLSLARVLITNPRVLLMDEPFAALDSDGVAIAAELLKDALRRDCAVVITAHEPLPLEVGATVYEITRGRLTAAAAPRLRPGVRAAG